MKDNELRLYAARNPVTGKLVSDITNPRKKFWQIESAAKEAIRAATQGRYKKYESLELVTFKLVEVKDDGPREVTSEPDDDAIIKEERKLIRAAIQKECARFSDCDDCPHTDGFCNYYSSSDAPIEILRQWYAEMFCTKEDDE
jgi:hypothetical protein